MEEPENGGPRVVRAFVIKKTHFIAACVVTGSIFIVGLVTTAQWVGQTINSLIGA